MARDANSPADIFNLTKHDGHPVLWFILLYTGTLLTESQQILPIVSILVALAAVAVFMFYAPFQLWFRCMFIFGALPIYEYSVMARNYGISMLLIFLFAALYTYRKKYPIVLAFVLALLATSNVYSLMLSFIMVCIWIWDIICDKRNGSVQIKTSTIILVFIIILGGTILSSISIFPKENSILTQEGYSINLQNFIQATFEAIIRPDKSFYLFMPDWFPALMTIFIFYLIIFGLIQSPVLLLAAFGSQIMFGVFFRMFLIGGFRHQGLYLVFILMLYWVLIKSTRKNSFTFVKRTLFRIGLYVGVLLLILFNLTKAKYLVRMDIRNEFSSGKAFGEFLNSSPIYHNAIIIPEPDFMMETLPYYSDNKIFFPREHRFANTVSWTKDSEYQLSLGELLSNARDIQKKYDQQILILIGHSEIYDTIVGEKEFPFQKKFLWNAEEVADFEASTILIKEFNKAYNDENYRVYELR